MGHFLGRFDDGFVPVSIADERGEFGGCEIGYGEEMTRSKGRRARGSSSGRGRMAARMQESKASESCRCRTRDGGHAVCYGTPIMQHRTGAIE